MARSVRPRRAATSDVISSGMEVPADTMVNPMTASLTPRSVAALVAPLTSTLDPTVRTAMPAISLRTARCQPPSAALSSMSGSAPSLSSGCSLAVRISQMVLMISPSRSASPACQVTRPADAIPHTAAETAIIRGTSRRTSRLSTRRGSTNALLPSTTITLKILLPTTLLRARASDPCKTELRLTKSSGALVPSDTTVRPITS